MGFSERLTFGLTSDNACLPGHPYFIGRIFEKPVQKCSDESDSVEFNDKWNLRSRNTVLTLTY